MVEGEGVYMDAFVEVGTSSVEAFAERSIVANFTRKICRTESCTHTTTPSVITLHHQDYNTYCITGNLLHGFILVK